MVIERTENVILRSLQFYIPRFTNMCIEINTKKIHISSADNAIKE
jgi:hypothetical protein